MKTQLIAICAMAAFCACAKEMTPAIAQGEQITLNASLQESKTTLAQGGTVNWTEGDAIAVFTSSTDSKTNKGQFTLSSGAGTTSASFTGTMGTGDAPYYALYPYKATALKGSGYNFYIDATQTYAENTFASSTALMCAQFNSLTDRIQFHHICGVLRLQLTGSDKVSKIVISDKAGMKISGKYFMSTVNAGTDKQSLQPNGDNSTSVTIACQTPVQLGQTATQFHAVVPPGAFAQGLDVDIYGEGGTLLKRLSTAKAHTVSRAHVAVIAPLTVDTSCEDLSLGESANCYIIKTGGNYKFRTVEGNSSTALSGTSAAVLWETVNTGTAPATGSIVTSVEYKDGYISFIATGTPGNALIALKNGDAVVWSWHIWVPGTKVRAYTYSNMKAGGVMDRNLGALSASEDDPLSAGFLYEWGRKDPFMGSVNFSSEMKNTAGSTVSSVTSSDKGTYEYTNAHPCEYLSCPSATQSSGDWFWGGSKTGWDAAKTVSDPCPPGYRVMDYNTVWTSSLSYEVKTHGVVLDGQYWYPFGGTRWNTDGSIHELGSCMYYWTNKTWSTFKTPSLCYYSSGYRIAGERVHAAGGSVRCYTGTTPLVTKDEKKFFQNIPAGTKVSSIAKSAEKYVVSFTDGTVYNLDTGTAGMVQVSDDEYWMVNGVKTAYKHKASVYMTVGCDGFWYKNGSKTSERATPANPEAAEDDIVLTSIVENARNILINFSDDTSLRFDKDIKWGMYVKKTDKLMTFYMGHLGSKNWIGYNFKYRYKEYHGGTVYPDYYDNWGLNIPLSCTKNGESFTQRDVLFLEGEAEAAVQTTCEGSSPSPVYSGGVLHGFENIYEEGGKRQFILLVDGVEVGETETFSLRAASKIEITQKTKIARAYSAEGLENAYADIVKHWVFENGRLTISVEYTFLKEIQIYQAKFGMLCVKRNLTTGDTGSVYVTNLAIKDNNPRVAYTMTNGWESLPENGPIKSMDSSCSRIEEYGDYGISFALQYDEGNLKSTGGFNVGTNGNNYNKIYFDICGKYLAKVGDKLYSTVHWELDYVSEYSE